MATLEKPGIDRRRRVDALEDRRRRRERWLIGVVSIAIAGFTFFEVRLSSFSDGLPATNNLLFFGLVNLNVILTLLLVFLVFRNIAKLIFDRRNNVMGSKLRTKLVLAFAGFTLVPSLLLFSVATGFVVNSVNSWFDPFVESSLKDALKVAQLLYQRAEDDTKAYAQRVAAAVNEGDLLQPVSADSLRFVVDRKREEYRLETVEVFGKDGLSIYRAVSKEAPLEMFPPVDDDFLRGVFEGKTWARTQPLKNSDVIRGAAPVLPKGCVQVSPQCLPVAAVVTTIYFPQSLVSQTDRIDQGFQGYQQLKIYASPLTTSYVMILTTITLVVVFAATWLGIHLAKGIAVPLKDLADGAKAVAAGNLDVNVPDPGNDEIGQVVRAFNTMTGDLKASREKAQDANIGLTRSNTELEQRRRYMEVVLTNIAAGVVALDAEGRVRAMNDAAARLLVTDREAVIGKPYLEVLPESYLGVARELLREIQDESVPSVSRQVSISINGEARTVMVHITPLRDPKAGSLGTVVLLDDLTPILRGQRVAAWREVARRIAHEIKNPLTPVQLSAQRLRRRFASQITEGREVFDECTETIERQVEELKNLVNEFSEFARMPESNPAPADLNGLVAEAAALYRNAHAGITVDFTPDSSVPVFDVDREQMKRAVINLLDNACAAVSEGGGSAVSVSTVFERALGIVRLTISDDGPGIAEDVKARLFEPYFSTKKTGTGLGLTIVHRIIADHEGFIRVQDNKPRGTRFVIELPAKGTNDSGLRRARDNA